jgi:hypothetical protein
LYEPIEIDNGKIHKKKKKKERRDQWPASHLERGDTENKGKHKNRKKKLEGQHKHKK